MTRALHLIVFTLILTLGISAQEPDAGGAPAAGGRGGRGGGRAGRGGGGGRGSTREFLGLGPVPDAAAAKKGEPLFQQNCAGCHGDTARGGQAPSLVRSVVVLHDEKGEEIGPVVKAGRPGMPPFPMLSQDDINNIAQFLHMQVELAANRGTYAQTYGDLRNKVTGDAKQGEAFFKANCTGCHSATGDLAKIGSKFQQAAQLQARFLWPAGQGARQVSVTGKDGKTVTGTVSVMDDFGISLYDAAGQYHYWPTSAVTIKQDDKLNGHRALLPKYSDADIHNMTAYLVTLK